MVSDFALCSPPATSAALTSIICQMYEIGLFQVLFVTVLFCMILPLHIHALFHAFLCINMHKATHFALSIRSIRTLSTLERPADFCHLQTVSFCSKKHTINCYQISLKQPKNIHLPISKKAPAKKKDHAYLNMAKNHKAAICC